MPGSGEVASNGPDEPRRVHPAFVHAFREVGFLVTEENAHTFSDEEVEAWNDAVAEGERRYGPID